MWRYKKHPPLLFALLSVSRVIGLQVFDSYNMMLFVLASAPLLSLTVSHTVHPCVVKKDHRVSDFKVAQHTFSLHCY